VTLTIIKAIIASVVAAKPKTASFEKKAKVISKKTPANTHSFNRNNLFGINNVITPATFSTPSK
jgi:hypothetical protein